ncbi:MAG: polyphosphate polymerase domain-containing protein [Blautia sp.]|jgi:hypothetical protein
MNEVLRQEKKYLLDYRQFRKLDGMYEQVLMPDAHNGIYGYPIRSLYFDTLEDTDFYDKEEGYELRRKIRLRTYAPGADFAMLEMKQKQGDYQKKRSLCLERDAARSLTRGDYSVLLDVEDPFARECYGILNLYAYRPKTVVEYQRKAYVAKENKIRLTFDHGIRASEVNYDIFDEKLNLYPVMEPYLVVLEVKYNGFLLSYIKDLLDACGKTPVSVSKYCLARSVGLHYLF